MRKLACILGVCALFALAANADEIAYWHFNDQTNLGTSLWRLNPLGTPEAKTEYARDYGSGTAELTAWSPIDDPSEGNLVGTNGVASGSYNDNFGSFAGTTMNVRHDVLAGGTLGIVGSANNGHYFLLELDDMIQGCLLSFAARATSTGHVTQTFDYSIDNGTTWTNLTTLAFPGDSTFHPYSVDFGDVFMSTGGHEFNLIRITPSGASSSAGTVRYDNMAIDGTIVPEPAGLLLLGLAGLLIRRR